MMEMRITRRRAIKLLALSAISLCLAEPTLIEPNVIVAGGLKVIDEVIPETFDGYRIVHISDSHLKGMGFREERSIELTKSYKPNLIVFTGDLIDDRKNRDLGIEYVEELSRIAPVILVYGNWDHWSGIDLRAFRDDLEALGNVKVLINESISIERGGETISIIGVDDPFTLHDNLDRALLTINEGYFKVLLAHSPQIIGKATSKVDLVLCGHTHGGQVVLPLLGPLYVPLPFKYRRYIAGVFNIGETVMYVNRGLGTSILPIRLLCPPEIALITLLHGPVSSRI